MKRNFIKLMLCLAILAVAAPTIESKTRKKAANSSNTSQVIYTGDIAKKVYGYNGTTPLNIHIQGGKITRIEALPNNETPQYFKRAIDKIFPLFEGKTVAEAKRMKVDAVTGATYSSEAVIKNIQMGLEQAGNNKANKKSK